VDHLFEIALQVAQSLMGFKHDEDCSHLADGHFEVLAGKQARGFGRNAFGK
jgi:hypothetical protein